MRNIYTMDSYESFIYLKNILSFLTINISRTAPHIGLSIPNCLHCDHRPGADGHSLVVQLDGLQSNVAGVLWVVREVVPQSQQCSKHISKAGVVTYDIVTCSLK